MKALIIAAALAASTAAQAEFISGNELYSRMTSSNQMKNAVALGFVTGVHDAYEGVIHCSGQNVTIGQASDVAQKFLRDNPDLRDLSAHLLVGRALQVAWPCPKKSPSSGGSL